MKKEALQALSNLLYATELQDVVENAAMQRSAIEIMAEAQAMAREVLAKEQGE